MHREGRCHVVRFRVKCTTHSWILSAVTGAGNPTSPRTTGTWAMRPRLRVHAQHLRSLDAVPLELDEVPVRLLQRVDLHVRPNAAAAASVPCSNYWYDSAKLGTVGCMHTTKDYQLRPDDGGALKRWQWTKTVA